MKIGVSSDHGGINLKEKIKLHLQARGIEVTDFGTDSTESVDYPDYGRILAEAVARGEV